MGRHYDYEWNYYSENRPRKVVGGIKARSDRGAIGATWWSRRWVNVLESLGMGTRLTRGRSYARQGQVLSIEIEAGLVKAKVQGSMEKPYEIEIHLHPLSTPEWERVTDKMAAQALFAAKLLAGEMPETIEEAFQTADLSLFPTTQEDLQTSCSCPDWANPCKHIAAVYYILAERFDDDPFLLFTLRGRRKEEVIKVLREKRVESLVGEATKTVEGTKDEEQPQMIEEALEGFWQAGEGLDTFAFILQDAPIDKAILKRLGAAPFAIAGTNVTDVLAKAYDGVEKEAARRILQS